VTDAVAVDEDEDSSVDTAVDVDDGLSAWSSCVGVFASVSSATLAVPEAVSILVVVVVADSGVLISCVVSKGDALLPRPLVFRFVVASA